MEDVVAGIIITIVSITFSGSISYFLTHKYERKRDKNQIREKIATQLVLSWTNFDHIIHKFLNDPDAVNEASRKLTNSLNLVKGLFRIYATNITDLQILDKEFLKILSLHREMSKIVIKRNDRKLPYLEYLKLGEDFSIADTFLKILDLIGNLELK